MRRKSALSGSRGASSGAASAMKMMERPTRPPTADSVLRREKRASSTSNAGLITGSPPPAERARLAVASTLSGNPGGAPLTEGGPHRDQDPKHAREKPGGLAQH